ncbi:MAG TPA: hypothetical protein DEO89_08430 [Lachnospiraceae bacterium]|nr:hypothetical protein [Lachnospiraceae bacterium]
MHNISMRKIIRVCQAECYHFLCSGRLALVPAVWVFAYQFITVPLLQNAERMHASLLVIEPYIALINSNFMILIMPVLFLVLLSDFPRVDANAYFYLVRTGKTNWVLGQLLYGVVITAGYLLMQFAGMVIPVLAEGRWGTGWSPVITDFAREFPEYAQSAGAVSIQPQLYYHVPPWEAVLVGSALLAAYLYLLLLIKLLCFLLRAKTIGLLLCFFVIAFGTGLCTTFSQMRFLMPMGNSILGIHYSQYYMKMVFPLEYSVIYFAVLIGVFIIGIIGLRKRLGGQEHD